MDLGKIIISATNAERQVDKDRLSQIIISLYKLEIFKDGLDAIISGAMRGDVSFEIKLKERYSRLDGCCRTSKKLDYNRQFGIYQKQNNYLITIENISASVIAHEIVHALEKESKLILNDEFRKAITLDLSHPRHEARLGDMMKAIMQVMKEEVASYPPDHILSELLARCYELMVMSAEVGGWSKYQFRLSDINDFFANTTLWIAERLNQNLKARINADVALASLNIARSISPSIAIKTESLHANTSPTAKKSWKDVIDRARKKNGF